MAQQTWVCPRDLCLNGPRLWCSDREHHRKATPTNRYTDDPLVILGGKTYSIPISSSKNSRDDSVPQEELVEDVLVILPTESHENSLENLLNSSLKKKMVPIGLKPLLSCLCFNFSNVDTKSPTIVSIKLSDKECWRSLIAKYQTFW